MTEQKITVTLNQESPFKKVLMRAEDTARELLVYIVGTDGTALDMSGMMAEFRAKKPDNTEIARTEGVTIEGEYVRVEITANTIAVAGIVSCEILLYFNGVEIGTAPFDIDVWEARVRDSTLNSNSDFQSAIAAAAAAQAAADRAESFASHPNIVLANGNWGVWNGSEYEDSGVRAVAQDGRVYEVHAGTNVSVDNIDPANPIVSSSGVGGIVAGLGIDVDDTDPSNPVLSAVGTITVYTHTKAGTVHTLSNVKGGENIKFTAAADYEVNDTFDVNGTVITMVNGTPSFEAGETVLAFLDGTTLNFLTPEANTAQNVFIGSAATGQTIQIENVRQYDHLRVWITNGTVDGVPIEVCRKTTPAGVLNDAWESGTISPGSNMQTGATVALNTAANGNGLVVTECSRMNHSAGGTHGSVSSAYVIVRVDAYK